MKGTSAPSVSLSELGLPSLSGLRSIIPFLSALLRKLPRLRLKRVIARQDNTAHDFVLLIFVHYKGWKNHSSGMQSMQLDSVKNDVKRVLDYLRYRHDGTSQRYYFLMDFEYEYTDLWGKTKLLPRNALPTRDAILRTVHEVANNSSSGLIYYGGHCHCSEPGISQLDELEGSLVYREIADVPKYPKAAYLVCSDAGRIYGRDIDSLLPNRSKNGGASTITLVLDTCKAVAFTEDFDDLRTVDQMNSADTLPDSPPFNQLVVVAASQAQEPAGTFGDCGALTYFLTRYLRENADASAIDVVRHLNAKCEGRQHPQIMSQHPIRGAFRLLPGES